MGRSEALKVFKVWTNPRFFSTSTVSFCLIHLSQWHQHGTLWTLTLINICFLQKIINSHLKILFVCINYVISESFHYISPFPSAPFNIIFAFQFIISWFPTHKFWRSAFSPNTPRLFNLIKAVTDYTFLRPEVSVSGFSSATKLPPVSDTHPGLRLDTAAHTQLHRLRHKGWRHPSTLPAHTLLGFCSRDFLHLSHWLGKVEVCSDGSGTDKNFIAPPQCEKSCNCFSTQPKLQIFC